MVYPLNLLRDYNVNKQEIIERDDQIIFGEISWPKHVLTNYLIRGSKKDGSAKEYYRLDSLLFFLKNVDLTHVEYFNEANAANIPSVHRADRKQLLAYLNGVTETSPSIDTTKSAPKFTIEHVYNF